MRKEHAAVVVGMIERVMRTNGFHGSIEVKNVRYNKNAKRYSARVVADLAGTKKIYRAEVPGIAGRKIKIVAV